MINRYFRCLSILILMAMAGCASLPLRVGDGSQVTPTTLEGTESLTVSVTLDAKQTVLPTEPGEMVAATLPPGGLLLRIWLPPEFDPDGDSPASKLLKLRLEEFETANPDIRLETRVKALEGSGGLLESLVAANAAAPLALPDLVLLPRPLLESATLKGLLYPYDGLTSIMDDLSWFEYAKQIAEIKSSTYGIPFAGDAMALAYHPSLLETPPPTVETSLSLGEVMLYPATDPQALYTLVTYLANVGGLQDEQGRPYLDVATLTNVLEFDQRASMAGVMPYWLTQYSNDAQVWEAFVGNQYPMAVTWTSTYLDHKNATPADLALAPLPTPDDAAFTLASGWSWALAGQDPERRSQAIRLAEFLVDKEFLAEWTYAAGYLPPRADALQGWKDATLRQVIEQISASAQLIPSEDILSSLGPALEQAVVDVLKAQSDPQTAAQVAINQINKP